MTKPLMRFKVHIDRRKTKLWPFFFWCTIWRNLPEARARMKVVSHGAWDNGIETAAGACYSWRTWSFKDSAEGVLMPEMGEIVLAESWAGSSTIAHEASHAAFRVGELIAEQKIVDEYSPEERHCLTVGTMSRSMVIALISLRKWYSPQKL